MTAPSLAQGLHCNAPQKPMLEISLMFGRIPESVIQGAFMKARIVV
jgi:hypothetical protein